MKMRHWKSSWITAVLLFLIPTTDIGGAVLIIKPDSSEASIGDKVVFTCSTHQISSEIQWFHYPIKTNSERQLVYGYGQLQASYKRLQMDKIEANATYNLIILSVTIEYAGKYECQDDFGRGDKSSAELIVLSIAPVCQSENDISKVIGSNNCGVEPDKLMFSCDVQYIGNEPPIMKWKKSGADDRSTINTKIPPTSINNKQIIYNVTMRGDSVENRSSYECFASRATATSTKSKCNTGNITIISKTVSVVECSCKGCSDAVICIFVFIVIPLLTALILVILWCRGVFRPKILRDFVSKKKTTKDVDEGQELRDDEGDETDERIQRLENDLQVQRQKYDDLQNRMTEQAKQSEDEKTRDIIAGKEKEIENLKMQNKKQKDLIELNEVTTKQLKKQVKWLEDKLKQLERNLYPPDTSDYMKEPKLVHKIMTESGIKKKAINGMAVLEMSLFVSHEKIPEIEVYDSATYMFQRRFSVPENSIDPLDLVSCTRNNCLYAIGCADGKGKCQIIRFCSKGKMITKWVLEENSDRLSTYESNVIACNCEKLVIHEYSDQGILVHTVKLTPAVGFHHPWHAIKVSSMHFVVSQGDVGDKLHRVCVINQEGNIIKECAEWEKKNELTSRNKFKVPLCVLEDKDRSILVADRDNKRLILLNSFMKYQRKVIDTDFFPVRLSFDANGKRLFVAGNEVLSSKDWKNGTVLIFNMK